MKEFRPCFVPLFVAVDAIGVLPAFLSLSQGMEPLGTPGDLSLHGHRHGGGTGISRAEPS